MKYRLLLLATITWPSCLVVASTPDVGAQIVAADAQLGARPGEIRISASGHIGGGITLSRGHRLICDNNAVIGLEPNSYIYQSSNTTIKNCVIEATPTPINGEVQSYNEHDVTLDHVTFVGGGNSVFWYGVKNFSILSSNITSIDAVWPNTDYVQSGFFLENCSYGTVDNLRASNFVFPSGLNSTGILGLNACSYVTIKDPVISNIDASYVLGGAAGIVLAGSDHITLDGAVITGNPNMDGILTEAWGFSPSKDITLSNVYSSYNGGLGLNTNAPLAIGSGLDIISTRHLRVTHSTLDGNGNTLHNQQAGVWLFIDEDVVIKDCDISGNSATGVASAGSRGVFLGRNTINRNQASGLYTEWQAGTATSVGTAVSLVKGVSGGFGPAWKSGTPFFLAGVNYHIAKVMDAGHLTLQTAPPDHATPVQWAVNSYQEVKNSVIDDNGQGLLGGQLQVGISWADGTTGKIIGVTSTNTGTGPQLYGLELTNQASALLIDDNFSGNLDGGNGINGSTQVFTPSSLLFSNREVSTSSPPETVLLISGAFVTPQLTIQTSGDFSQTNNCGSELDPYSECEIKVTFTPSAAGTRKGTLTVTDGAPNSPMTASLAGNGLAPGLGLGLAPGASGTATVAAGKTAQYSLSIGGAGLSGKATLTCSGVPKGAKCELPPNEDVNSGTPSGFTVSVPTTSRTLAAIQPSSFRPSPWLWAMTIVGLIVFPLTGTIGRSARRHLFLLPLLLCLCLTSCGGGGGAEINRGNGGGSGGGTSGGGGSNPSGTPAGTYILTVTAMSGSNSEQIQLTLTVQ